MLRSVDAALAALQREDEMADLKETFDGFDPAEHEAEVKARWGVCSM